MKQIALAIFVLTVSHLLLAENKLDTSYIDDFFDEESIKEYNEIIDALIDQGEAKQFSSLKSMTDIPSLKTSKGIKFNFTVNEIENGLGYHVSISRAPYLPHSLGEILIGLFKLRAGLPEPIEHFVSPNQVFHSFWIFSGSSQKEELDKMMERRKIIRNNKNHKEIFTKALMESNKVFKEKAEPAGGANATR